MTNPFDDHMQHLEQEKRERKARVVRFVGEYSDLVLRVLTSYRDVFYPDCEVFGPHLAYAFAVWTIGFRVNSGAGPREFVRVLLRFEGESMSQPSFGVHEFPTCPTFCPATEADLVEALKRRAAVRGAK